MAAAIPSSPRSHGDCFLKIVSTRAGAIKGETEDPDYPSQLALSSWSWGVNSSQGLVSNGKPQGRSLDFTCLVDSACTALFSALVTNDRLKTVTLEMRRAGGAAAGAKAQRFLKIELIKARLSSLDLGFSESQLVPIMRGSLFFETIEMTYSAQGRHGSDGSGASTFRWDISDEQ